MALPGFTAADSLRPSSVRHRCSGFSCAEQQSVLPQFCTCQCYLRRVCIPINATWHCYYIRYCVPVGTCPPGYCQSW